MTPARRIPFKRPPEASFYTPRVPSTAFYSHINPFMNVYPPMAALQTRIPGLANRVNMAPGISRLENTVSPRRLQNVRQQMPAVVAPPAQTPMGPTGPGPAVTPDQPAVNGFGYAGFGATGGVGGGAGGISQSGSPYRVMRSGMFPGIVPNATNLRHGVHSAGAHIRAQTNAAYPGANVPAGRYAGG